MREWLLVWVLVSGYASDPETNLPDDQTFGSLQACQRAEQIIEEELNGAGYSVKAACIELSEGESAASRD
jgi:hypothetical protein